ncbi:MAG: 6-bladed beta-propeller [Actinomycetota bacterium]
MLKFSQKRWAFIAGFLLLAVLAIILVYLFYSKPRVIRPPEFLFSIKGKSEGARVINPLRGPLGITIFQDRVFVADSGNSEVKIFNLDGRFLSSFPVTTIAVEKPTTYPVGITIDDDGKIYVSEIRSQKLMVFNFQGRFLYNFPRGRENSRVLIKPLAVTFANDKLYVTDIGDQSVKVFDKRGRLLLKFGKKGSKKGDFLFPNGITALEDGTILVADSNNRRVQVFDPQGNFLSFLGRSKALFNLPRGIAIDGKGRIHVVDTFSRAVFVFDAKGKHLFSYGGFDEGEHQFGFPNGIAISSSTRRIYITDRGKNSVMVWRY